jgi:hypothetical protein
MKRILRSFGLALAGLVFALPAPAQEALPPGAKVTRVEVRPDKVELKTPFEYRQLLVTGVLANGDRVDLTRQAKFTAPANLVKVSDRGQVRPAGDGQGEIAFTVAGKAGKVPVKVAGQKDKVEVSFTRDVMPVMSRMGCNAGTCHGSAKGKNGFQLSLRGYDPVFDHRALTDDLGSRRLNRAAPVRSLMLLKTTGAVPHVGGVLTQPGEPYYEILRTWIAEGVKLDVGAPKVTKIEVYPAAAVIPLPGLKQQMTVTATYSDGTTRDVSAEAFLESSNSEVATIDKASGIVTAVRRGETAVLARYEGNYAAATIIIMGDRSGFAWKETPTYNWIDTLVYDKLKEVKILPSGVCTDADFVRRLYLDLTGLPPEPETVRAFLADSTPSRQKREQLVDKLLASPDFVDHWTNKWADLLQVNRKFLGNEGATAFRDWIKKAVATNMPYDQFSYQLLTASGSNVDNPPASYFKILRDPTAAMENTTHLFMAVRFNCNKCHDHPFERWTQSQYYELSSYFAQVSFREDPKHKGKKTAGTAVRGPLPVVEIVEDKKDGEVKNERTGQNAVARFPFTHAGMPKNAATRREALAKWITSKENPYFAKSYVNRVWSYLLGVGIIEPVDDIRAGNPPTNPALLEKLTDEFEKSGFNVRQLIRTICTSRTYQHAVGTNEWNKDDDVNYSHAIARRLPAEVLFDSIHRVIGSPSNIPGMPRGTRAAQLIDSSVKVPGGFLDLFGRPPRESACECERSSGMQLGPVLNLVTGPVINDAIRDPSNRIAKLVAAQKDDAKLVEELYLAVLNRKPTPQEVQLGAEALKGNEADFNTLAAERKRREADLAAYERTLPEKQAAWEGTVARTPAWTVLEPVDMKAAGGAKLEKQSDNSVLVTGPNNTPETYTVKFSTKLKGITGLRLEVLADDRLPKKGPGRAPNGNFVLNELRVNFQKHGVETKKPTPVKLVRPQADFSQGGFPIANAVDNNPETGWAIADQLGKSHVAVFEVQNKFGGPEGTTITVSMLQKFAGKEHNVGKFRVSVTTIKPPVLLQGQVPENITKLLDLPANERTKEQQAQVTNYYRSIDQELARLQRRVSEYTVPASPRALGAQDLTWALINSPAFLFNHSRIAGPSLHARLWSLPPPSRGRERVLHTTPEDRQTVVLSRGFGWT